MAEAALYVVVKKLGDLVIQNAPSLQGVEEQVKALKNELQRMQCFLRDAAERQGNDERVRNWISEIREVAQDAEDVIEGFIFRFDAPIRNRSFLRKFVYSPIHLYQLNNFQGEIESIRARIDAIDKSRVRYDIQSLDEGTASARRSSDLKWRRRLSPWQLDKHVVGVEEDVESLLENAILKEGKCLSVAGIVGMAGIGKSTLARMLFNHGDVAAGFDCRAWVVVSSKFNPEEIIKELVLQLVVEPNEQLQLLKIMEKATLEHLQRLLYARLKGKRYFIILDDVWEESHVKSLESAFPDEDDKGSRLLLTSRRQDILSCTQYVHRMKILNPDKSWELFLKKVSIGQCPKDLEKIGREILTKCGGLPLAIAVIGSLLAKKRQSKSEWEDFRKGMSSHLGRRGSSVSAILELSYHNLPPELKSCFLCLGFFKEDDSIRAEKLVQIWGAQGLIPEGGAEETMEDIGRSYLDELVSRSLVEANDMDQDDRVKNCRVHDLIRELSITKAMEEISFEIKKEVGNSQSLHKPRHQAIYCSTEWFMYSGNRNKHLRSLFFHGEGNIGQNLSYWKGLELLRVLDFEGFGLESLPETIGSLIGLRYLGLRNTKIWKLPSSLGCLKNLQVLDISQNFIFMMEVPNVLWKMDSLCHLYMSDIIGTEPLKIDTLKNLQTLSCMLESHWKPDERAAMLLLRNYGLEFDFNSVINPVDRFLEYCFRPIMRRYELLSMPSLDGLGTLDRLTKVELEGKLTTLPGVSDLPPNLSHLSLIDTHLVEDPMGVLEKLPKLTYLKLDRAFNGVYMVASRDGFPRLKVLTLRWLYLKHLEILGDGMPEIKRLEIYRCEDMELDDLPEKLRSVAIALQS